MTLLLRPHEVQGVISMRDAIEAVEIGFKDWSRNRLLNAPRRRVFAPSGVRTSVHQAGVPDLGVTGLLVHCEHLNETPEEQIQEGIAPHVGVLYSTQDASLLAVIIGEVTAREVPGRATALRTAATSAVGTKFLARVNSSSVGILGSGVQAKNHLVALSLIRPVTRVKVYSRTQENREVFAESMGRMLGIDVRAVESAEEAVKGSDIVLCATNSSIPVLDGNWLEPGMHVISIVGSNVGLVEAGLRRTKRRELDDTTIRRADLILVNSVQQVKQDEQADIYDPVTAGIRNWNEIYELGQLLSGEIQGRTSDRQITLLKNNAGQGVADVAILAKVYQIAKDRNLGIEIPTTVLGWAAR